MMLVVLILTTGIGVLIQGIVLRSMWGWFVSPLGFPEISWVWALGLTLTVHLWREVSNQSELENLDLPALMGKILGYRILGPLLVLVMGWLLHQGM